MLNDDNDENIITVENLKNFLKYHIIHIKSIFFFI